MKTFVIEREYKNLKLNGHEYVCQNCNGEWVDEEYSFCPHCGREIDWDKSHAPNSWYWNREKYVGLNKYEISYHNGYANGNCMFRVIANDYDDAERLFNLYFKNNPKYDINSIDEYDEEFYTEWDILRKLEKEK